MAAGAPCFPPEIALKLLRGVRRMKAPPPEDVVQEPLTPRQEEILALLGEGRADAEIARMLTLQEATVRAHIHHILQRLGFENRAQAAAYAHPRRSAAGRE
ncbi:MAG: response regulator transcription factor [Anaerolineales bacterium]